MDDWFYKGLIQGLKDKKVNLIRGTNQRSVPHLRAVVSRIEPGFYAGVISSPSELDVTLQVLEGSEVSHEITYQSSGVGFSTGERESEQERVRPAMSRRSTSTPRSSRSNPKQADRSFAHLLFSLIPLPLCPHEFSESLPH
jgi:hypothetical protein